MASKLKSASKLLKGFERERRETLKQSRGLAEVEVAASAQSGIP